MLRTSGSFIFPTCCYFTSLPKQPTSLFVHGYLFGFPSESILKYQRKKTSQCPPIFNSSTHKSGKQHHPGDSIRDLLITDRWRSPTTFPKGHVFTIPKRSPAELPGSQFSKFCDSKLPCWRIISKNCASHVFFSEKKDVICQLTGCRPSEWTLPVETTNGYVYIYIYICI